MLLREHERRAVCMEDTRIGNRADPCVLGGGDDIAMLRAPFAVVAARHEQKPIHARKGSLERFRLGVVSFAHLDASRAKCVGGIAARVPNARYDSVGRHVPKQRVNDQTA